MKSLILLFSFILLMVTSVFAQNNPRGMKYQAVARDMQGNILENENIQLRIAFLSNEDKIQQVHYREIHAVVTNKLGLFSLVLGEGKKEIGGFDEVPWSSKDIWMEIQIKAKGESSFSSISNSQLLAVPYAFHAVTASKLVENGISAENANGVPSQTWSLKGNTNSNPAIDKLGTSDNVDLVIVTNDIERLRIENGGGIEIAKGLTIANNAEIGKDLIVKKNVFLNTEGGQTINNGSFTVTNMSPTSLSGLLTVDKDVLLKDKLSVNGLTDLNNGLNVNNMSPSNLSGILNVDKDSWLKDKLRVDGLTDLNNGLSVNNMSASNLSGILNVDKDAWLKDKLHVDGLTELNSGLNVNNQSATHLTGSLTVDGTTSLNALSVESLNLKSLNITDNQTGFLASIENTNTGVGDGLKIKLGGTHPAWINSGIYGPGYINITNFGAEFIDNELVPIKNLFYGEPVTLKDFASLALGLWPNAWIYGTICEAIIAPNIAFINDKLSLPRVINAGSFYGGQSWTINPPGPGQYTLTIPQIPVHDRTIVPALPDSLCEWFPSFSLPKVRLNGESTSLTKNNQFISFVDKDDKELGSIRAQSIEDWNYDYLDGSNVFKIIANLVGVDLLGGLMNGLKDFTDIAKSYNSLGVEYASGHGDYAEWLERTDPAEIINPGDIVGVRGGKVSKDLTGAEQILAVSHNPIMLGNAQSKEREPLGNKIAFTGQVPVKVMGPVSVGDYIIGKGDIIGYGIAISPDNLTTDDLKSAVGRSWETNMNAGPKMVNTLIGIDNGDYIKIMKESQDKIEMLELRINSLDEKLNQLIDRKGKKNRK